MVFCFCLFVCFIGTLQQTCISLGRIFCSVIVETSSHVFWSTSGPFNDELFVLLLRAVFMVVQWGNYWRVKALPLPPLNSSLLCYCNTAKFQTICQVPSEIPDSREFLKGNKAHPGPKLLPP